MIKLCIWMNIPSHHQKPFFNALNSDSRINLEVRYFGGTDLSRTKEGWSDNDTLESYEQILPSSLSPKAQLETVPECYDRIHLISLGFNRDLVEYFCQEKISWCHWSEMSGIRLADLLSYKMWLYSLLQPLYIFFKRKDGRLISKNALGVFGQGILAKRSFVRSGIYENKISYLYYTPAPLNHTKPAEEITMFAKQRKVFLCVSALCERKGIDVLLKAYARLESKDWCLVFCGLDKEYGKYQELSKDLGIEDNTLFLGAYSADNISDVYSSADVFVLPSRFDGWGAVLNEAASIGLPLIATDLCGASWHLIKDGINGYRVKANSVNSLSSALRFYIDQPELVKSHGAESLKIFTNDFTPEKNVERLVCSLRSWSNI